MICEESERCQRCLYLCRSWSYRHYSFCQYILYRHKRRGCPVDRCNKFIPTKKAAKKRKKDMNGLSYGE